jgi:hypothetical protein
MLAVLDTQKIEIVGEPDARSVRGGRSSATAARRVQSKDSKDG